MRVLTLLVALTLIPVAVADHGVGVYSDPALAPTPSDVQEVVAKMAGVPGATVHVMGNSTEGRPIYAVELVDPTSNVSRALRTNVFIMTQQHGNEPAGTPAALALLADFRAGHLAVPDDVVLIIMPQSNPDGALANQRAGAHGEDINRDHVDVGTPESTAIHAVLQRWDVHLAFDHHEYGGLPVYGIGYPSPVGSYDYDITTMFPNHGNVRVPTRDMSLAVNEAIKEALAAEGYTHGDYGMTTIRAGPGSQDLAQTAGGPDPGILRNSYGLNNVAGLLIESFVPPADAQNPFQSFDRRVASQRTVMDAVIVFADEHGPSAIAAKRTSEALNLEQPPSMYVEGDIQSPLPQGYAHEAHEAFARHGLPDPALGAEGTRITVIAQERAGLIAALLHPDSTRAVVAARAASDAELEAIDSAYYAHDDFGVQEMPAPAPAEDAAAPGASIIAALALVAAVLVLRRR